MIQMSTLIPSDTHSHSILVTQILLYFGKRIFSGCLLSVSYVDTVNDPEISASTNMWTGHVSDACMSVLSKGQWTHNKGKSVHLHGQTTSSTTTCDGETGREPWQFQVRKEFIIFFPAFCLARGIMDGSGNYSTRYKRGSWWSRMQRRELPRSGCHII